MNPNIPYVKAPPGWTHTDPNPFTQDAIYGSLWSAFCLLDRDDDQFFTGQSGQGPFSARFGRKVPHLGQRLVDFLRYENAQGRTVILSFPEGMDIDSYVAQALDCTPGAGIVRPEDPAILVHSTSKAAWESIRRDGRLKAASQLADGRQRSSQPGQLAEYLSHEPPEYKDYIMFSSLDSCVPEMVVASNQSGRFILDENAVYQPGVRLYFDNHRIIRDCRGTRDGLHVMKVRLELPLQPYLLAAVGVDDLDPQGQVQDWTLRAFMEKTNQVFYSRIIGPQALAATSKNTA